MRFLDSIDLIIGAAPFKHVLSDESEAIGFRPRGLFRPLIQ
jgi:hypothetical protein